MKKLRKLIAWLLATTLVLSLVPTAFAAGSVEVSTFAELKNAVNKGESQITLTADITATETLTLKKNLTLLGGNHSLSGNDTFTLIYAGEYTLSARNVTFARGNAVGGGYADSGLNCGGAVSGFKAMSFDHCTFTGNTAPGDGGAIYTWAEVEANYCTFSSNSSGRRGGAILAAGFVSLNNSIFTDCTSSWFGGAVMLYGNSLEARSTNFTNCTATATGGNGGAVHGDSGDQYYQYCAFTSCKATTNGFGGALYSDNGSIEVEDCTMASCQSQGGAAIFTNAADITATRVTEYSNVSTDGHGHFVSVSGKVNVLRSVYNEAMLGEYMLAKIPKLYIADSFTLSTTMVLQANLELIGPADKVTIGGTGQFTLFNGGAYALKLSNLVLTGGNAAVGSYQNANGGAVSSTGGDITATNCEFRQNYAPAAGGALYSWGSVTLTECQFSDNRAGQNGGAVYAGGIITSVYSQYSNNQAAWFGGALKGYQKLISLTNDQFIGNKATDSGSCGGAVHTDEGNIAATLVVFKQNSAYGMGGAIGSGSGAVNTEQCTFTENKTTQGYGSCVYSNANITYCNDVRSLNLAMGAAGHEYCSNGGIVTDNSDTLKMVGASLRLGGKIGVDFYFEIPKIILDDPEIYALYTVPNGGSFTTEKVYAGGWQETKVSTKTYYMLTPYVTSIELTQPIQVQFFKNDAAISEVFTYKAADYAQTVVQGTGFDTKLVEICKSILNYGAYAQDYFGYYTDDLPNSILSPEDKDVSAVTAAQLEPYQTVIEGDVPGIHFAGNMMNLESGAKIRLLFKLDDGYTLDDFSFRVSHGLAELFANGNYYEYDYDLVASNDLGTYIPFTVSNGSDELVIRICALSYPYQVLSFTGTAMPEKLVNLMKAMYLYYTGTCQYTGQPLIPASNLVEEYALKAFRMFPYFWLTDEAWELTLQGLLSYQSTIDEVVLFCDAMHSPYMSDAMLNEYAAALAKRTDDLRERGFKVGYNMLQTVGHGDYAAGWLDTPTYKLKLGYAGQTSAVMPCPRDTTFLNFIAHKYDVYAQLSPDFIWIDDDFRTNDQTVPYGCFCQDCIAAFNAQYGHSYTRSSLVDVLQSKSKPNVRTEWLNFTYQSYENVLKVVTEAVKQADPDIEMRLMTVHLPAFGSTLSNLAGYADAIDATAVRTGGGFFDESEPLTFLKKIYGVSEQIAQLRDVPSRQFESEDWPQTYNKSGFFHVLETTAAIMAGCNGVAYASIPPDQGNAYVMDAIAGYSNVWDEMVAIGDTYRLYGATTYYPNNYYVYCNDDNFFSQNGFGSVWNSFQPFMDGFMSYTPYQENAAVTILTYDLVNAMTDAEITEIFSKGVMIDGQAARQLVQRGFANLVGCSNSTWTSECINERYTTADLNGAAGGTIRYTYGTSYFNFTPLVGAIALSNAESVTGYKMGVSSYVYENELGGRVFASGYQTWEYDGMWQRMTQYDNIFDWLAKDHLYAKVENAQHVALLYKQPDDRSEFMLMAMNTSMDETPNNALIKLDGIYRDKIYCYDQYGKLTRISTEDIFYDSTSTYIKLPHLTAWGFTVLYTAV